MLEFILFLLGILIGGTLGYLISLRLEKLQIEGALDTIGIRRREFMALKGEVDSCWRILKENDDRIKYLERAGDFSDKSSGA